MEQAANTDTKVTFLINVPTQYSSELLKDDLIIDGDMVLNATIKAPEETLKKVSNSV